MIFKIIKQKNNIFEAKARFLKKKLKVIQNTINKNYQ